MKINELSRGEAMSRLLPVSTFRNLSVLESAAEAGSRVAITCDIRERVQGGNVSAAGSSVVLRHAFVQTISATTVLMPRTTTNVGTAKHNGMGAPRGIPPRERPKWA